MKIEPIGNASILIVQHDPDLRRTLIDVMREANAEVASASNGRLGAVMIVGRRYDIALISATLPGTCVVDLLALAAGVDIPVVLVAERDDPLQQYGFPLVPALLDASALVRVVGEAICHPTLNIMRVKASLARMQANVDAAGTDLLDGGRLPNGAGVIASESRAL